MWPPGLLATESLAEESPEFPGPAPGPAAGITWTTAANDTAGVADGESCESGAASAAISHTNPDPISNADTGPNRDNPRATRATNDGALCRGRTAFGSAHARSRAAAVTDIVTTDSERGEGPAGVRD